MTKTTILFSLLFCLISFQINAQRYLGVKPTDSGGLLSYAQASYDVRQYDLDLSILIEQKAIRGSVRIQADVLSPIDQIVLDLDSAFEVSKVVLEKEGALLPIDFEHKDLKLYCTPHFTFQPQEEFAIRVYYSGKPKVAPRPPWVGGFMWEETEEGKPWIATACQFDGADLWFPCKDHPSDEAEHVRLNITVPKGLEVVSNGVLENVSKSGDSNTFQWIVNSPINNYNIALNIAPYEHLKLDYTNVLGEEMPLNWWVLPEHKKQAKAQFPQFKDHLKFYEKVLGPYPFRSEKYGIVETPHLGMEHQTAIAYGADFTNNEFGFDFLHHHELGHEWWGNLVTASDWKDFWIHEGFCIYMQVLYAEELGGMPAYHKYISTLKPKVRNKQALAPLESKSTLEKYFFGPCYIESDGDIYTKGALVLHTLRYLVGEEALLKGIRKLAYPTKEAERSTDGSQCHFVNSTDFIRIMEEESGMELDWYFELYLRQPDLPNLVINQTESNLTLQWDTPKKLAFPMPVEVVIDGKKKRIEVGLEEVKIPLEKGVKEVLVDPENWIYKASDQSEKEKVRAAFLAQFPKAKLKEVKRKAHFTQYYEIYLPQPLDHSNPKNGTFEQKMYLGHVDFEKPILIETEGYQLYNYPREISKITKGNQLLVEYRFYGESVPKGGIPWKYLTNDLAIEDYHRIVSKLKNVYTGKWISSGVSKGGETTLIYKSKYPNDVDVAVPYVAPIILGVEDPRTDQHINTVGEKTTRKRITEFQRTVLQNRTEVLKEIEQYAAKKEMKFSVGLEVALEYAVLEFPFSYWQWGGNVSDIPTKDAPAKELFNYLNQIVGISFYSDITIDRLLPSYYQHMKELGYYGFDTTPVADLLEIVHKPTNSFFAPQNVDLTYNPNYMKEVVDFLESKGDNILYIYGEYDTWGACAVNPSDKTNALKMVLKKGSHATRIRHFSVEDQIRIYSQLKDWLGVKVEALGDLCLEKEEEI
ncbi:M1 family aminopeptidase [Sediminitomix flava]|uniref:Aminopeptidase N n=1 Tax=Sediminitomix flava TaxID=379075 RepID=A0A315ZFW6_SEDFL|nr:M1 family aminopeptidase [Sediminitomix flava]PWJ43748.1 peptidase M1-like protein [Sediminitomix flava]